MINDAINKLKDGVSIPKSELLEVFEEVFSGLSDDIKTSSFITALDNNKFDEEAFSSAVSASCASILKPNNIKTNGENLIENISFSSPDYIDISLLQDLICAACGLGASRYSFTSVKARDNSFDILSILGFNFEKDFDYSKDEFEHLNFCYFLLQNESPYLKYSEDIRLNLPFDNIFNYTVKMLNPLCAKNIFLGIKDKNLVEKFANVMLKLNKTNSIVLSGQDGFPFVSPNGESFVAEAWKNKIFTYVLTPDLLGFKDADFSKIKCESKEENANDILEIIQNKKKDAKYDAAIINSGLSLYIAKRADSLIEGIELAKKAVDSGLLEEKFEQIKRFYS